MAPRAPGNASAPRVRTALEPAGRGTRGRSPLRGARPPSADREARRAARPAPPRPHATGARSTTAGSQGRLRRSRAPGCAVLTGRPPRLRPPGATGERTCGGSCAAPGLAAGRGAVSHRGPIAGPPLAPGQGSSADGAGFRRQEDEREALGDTSSLRAEGAHRLDEVGHRAALALSLPGPRGAIAPRFRQTNEDPDPAWRQVRVAAASLRSGTSRWPSRAPTSASPCR